MSLTKTPACNLGEKAKEFSLLSTKNENLTLDDIKGENGTLIMFICNHCPYVKAVIKNIVEDVKYFQLKKINAVGIMSNDTNNYPEDSFENMKNFSNQHKFSFPYLIDETQEVAKKYGAVCTPDFFAYNSNLELQYRGRIRELKNLAPIDNDDSDLKKAFDIILKTGKGPSSQYPSMGCNIKWLAK